MTNAVIVEPGHVPVGGVGTDASTAGRAAMTFGRARTVSGHTGDVILGRCHTHGTAPAACRATPASTARVLATAPQARCGRHTEGARAGSTRAERA
jgi:hypothetical protein